MKKNAAEQSVPAPAGTPLLDVSPSEADQKLLQFLARRLGLAQNMLHRWIRTGQVRRNGLRAKPFDRLNAGDGIRIPPFALRMAATLADAASTPALPEIIAELPDLLVINKPAGLTVHPGSGHEDSLSSRLAAHPSRLPFTPTPAHRLDKDTSGLVLVALSYARLRSLHEAFAARAVHREYLAWTEGAWHHEAPYVLQDFLLKAGGADGEKMRARQKGEGKEAVCEARCLRRERMRSLLRIRLFTGRTHQIRAQLALRGHPVWGDVKYGARPRAGGMLLHACMITLPDGECFACPPPWEGDIKKAVEMKK